MPTEASAALAYPLARWADRRLRALAELTGAPRIAALNGPLILGERALGKGYRVPGTVSAGLGGSRLMPARDGWIALTIARPDDRDLLPALFLDELVDPQSTESIKAAVARCSCDDIVAQGRLLGLAIASADEGAASAPATVIARGEKRRRNPAARPLVVDLTAIWAGPLTGHLLWLAGAEAIKVESQTRPDTSRHADPALFAQMHQGKASVVVDFSDSEQKAALIDLIRRADIVIEAARPRGLLQLGIDADALVRACPGLVWLTVTGHGASGEPANWIGFGHDCGVAAGLSRALEQASGEMAFVGDALPDALTGIVAATEGWQAFQRGEACRIGLALSGVAAMALSEERDYDAGALDAELRAWSAARGEPLPYTGLRELHANIRPFGADNEALLGIPALC